jgi:S-adenosylmethionine:tRNA ribosyltransferase-isomerase
MDKIYDILNYDYEFNEKLIAQKPLQKRDESKLLVLNKKTGEIIHDRFFNLINYINSGDCLVINNTKVLPARLFGEKKMTGAKIEILLDNFLDENIAEVMMKNSRRIKEGDIILFPGKLSAEVLNKKGKMVDLKFNFKKQKIIEIFKKYGFMPLPPYIKENKFNEIHKKTYQTVFSKKEGAKAAPTAGFHFTQGLLNKLKKNDVKIAQITLHTGIGTFEPILTKDIREHKMHSEYFEINKKAADIINETIQKNKEVIAVGTTSLRTLESCAENGKVNEKKGKTSLYIYPGYKFKIVNKLITNFHLPKTTLFILVCAFAGIENIKKAYNEAIKNNYRFYSYGDAMLII